MKAMVCRAYGSPESLSHEEFPMPVAGAGQVLIKVAAAGVNFLDTLIIEGKYQDRPALPFVPGSEAAGVVVEVGVGVSGFAVGDRVLAMHGWNAYAEYMAVNVTGQVFHLPANMDFVIAAGFGIAYSTSLLGLRQKAHLAAGETLLVLAAGSGVGLTAVELGALMGARVIAAASSTEKLERARHAGASETINYREESLKSRVMELTGGRGVDVVYDPVGGDFFDAAVRTLAWNGRHLVVGFASGRIPALPANLLLLKGISTIGVLAGGFQRNEPALQQANFEDLLRWYAQGKLHPQVSRTAPLAQAARMLTAIARGEVQGKVVLTCSDPDRPAVVAPLETQAKTNAGKLAPGEDGDHITHCRLCDAYCGLVATVKNGRITKVMPDKDNVVSRGFLCPKGPGMAAITHDPDRVLYPLKRSGAPGEFKRVSWDEALGDIAQRLGAIRQDHGGEAIAMYVGNPAAAATFTNHIAAGLLKTLGSNQYYTPAAADTAQRWVATEAVYGQPVLPIPDLPNCDFLLVIAANPLESHGSLLTSPRIRDDMDAIAARGRVVVIDPRKTKTAARYEHVPILPNADVYLLIGMLRVLFDEHLADQDFLHKHVKGLEILSVACGSFSVEQCAQFCGVDAPTIRELARRLAAPRAVCYSRIGICRASFGTLTNVLVEALNIVAGRLGQPGGWGFGFDPYAPAGASPRRKRPTYARARSRSGGFPSIAGTMPATVLADDISHASEHPIRALIVVAGNPARSYPEGDKLEAALQTLDLHVSMDLYINETNKYADYVLPATTFFEREDMAVFSAPLMARPALQFADRVLQSQGEARTEEAVLRELAQRLGLPNPVAVGLLPSRQWQENADLSQREALDSLLRAGEVGDGGGARPEGYSLDKLEAQHPHGVLLEGRLDFSRWHEQVQHEDGKLHLWSELIAGEFERLHAQGVPVGVGQLRLFGRRDIRSLNSWFHNVESLTKPQRPALLMHPADAATRGVATGALVTVSAYGRSVRCPVQVSDTVIAGSVCYPHGWGHAGGWSRANRTGGIDINAIASSNPRDIEAVSGAPLLDGIPVTVTGLVSRL